MNIWIVNHYANAPEAPGDARHFSHARELMRMGHQVRIVACNFVHLQSAQRVGSAGEAWSESLHDGVPFTWLRACPCEGQSLRRVRNMLEFGWRAGRMQWARGLDEPDLIMGSTPHPFAALAAERIAARFRVPFVLEVRDVWPFVLTEVGRYASSHPFVILVDRVMRYLYRRAARIILFSRHSAPLMEEYGADARKLAWISHGVDAKLCPAPTAPTPHDGFTVMYLGAHGQWNSLDTVLEAARLVQLSGAAHVRFRLIGEGACKRALMARAASEGIGNVSFEAPVAKYEIPSVAHEADAFVLNNRDDAVSRRWMSFNKLYEYMAAGRPVVFGSCAPDNPVHDARAGLTVPADDARAMADAVLQLAGQTEADRAEFGRRGRLHIEQHYSISQLARRFEEIAREVVKEYAESGPESRPRDAPARSAKAC